MTDQLPHADSTKPPPQPSYPTLRQPQLPEHVNGEDHPGHEDLSGHGGHRLMMIACCIPMLIIVGILVTSGAAGSGAILYAVLCTAMMALMMFAMPGGHRH